MYFFISEILAVILYVDKAGFHALICECEVASKVRTLKEEGSWLIALDIAVPHQLKARAKKSHLELCLSPDVVIGEYVSVSGKFQRVPGFSISDDIFSVREPSPI